MKRNLLIVVALLALCSGAYLSGRAYQRSGFASVPSVSASSIPSPNLNPPAFFGDVVYNDIATIPFADLYETLRDAPPHSRAQWLTEIEQMPEGPRKVAALCGYLRALVQIDPVLAGDLVVGLKRHRSPAMDAVISAAPPSAMPQLVNMLLQLPRNVREYNLTDHLGIVIDHWALVDPEAVARFLENHEELPIYDYADSFVKTWAAIDAQAAWKWLETHSENLLSSAVPSWLSGWFSADPHAAMTFAFAHVKDEKFADAVTGLAPELFEQNQSSAKEFVEHLPTAEMRQGALSEICRFGRGFDSPEGYASPTANFLVQFSPSEWPKNFSDVIDQWRDDDPTKLLNWVSHLAPEVQTKVIDHFPKPSSDEPERDFLPVLQIPKSNLRANLLRQLVKGLESDDQPAREAVMKLKLTPKQKAELAAFLPENGNR